jgi:hypothetical protein
MAVPARVAIQTFHQPTNQPTNVGLVCFGLVWFGLVGFSFINASLVWFGLVWWAFLLTRV